MRERGVLLLEVMAALVIFATAALATVSLLSQLGDTSSRVFAAERVLADQERLLAAHTLLTRDELNRRIGTQRVGRWLVHVERATPTLYRVAVGDTAAIAVATMVHREEPVSRGR